MPFEVPESWVWVTLKEITSTIGDGLHGTPQYNSEGDYFFINGNNLSNRKIVIKNETKRVSVSEYEKYKKPLNRSSILVSINGTIGNIGIYDGEKIMLGKSACYMNMVSPINIQYICIILESQYFLKYAIDSATGSTIKNVPLKAINNFKLPFPPISEQQRIVAEIEQWFALIDQIEQEKSDLQTIIKQTKSKILDLAIHGKLVPQDPNDEPAIELLKRINPNFTPCDNGHYTQLPEGWSICKLSKLCKIENGFAFSSNDYKSEGTPLIRISNIVNNSIDLTDCVYIQNNAEHRFVVNKGDLLIAMSGATTGKMGVYSFERTAFLNQRVGNIKILNGSLLSADYRNVYMQSKVDDILKFAYGGAQPNISASVIEDFDILLPPLEEQKRIVCTVNKVFTKLDTIMESL